MGTPKTFLIFDTETGGFPSKKKELTDDYHRSWKLTKDMIRVSVNN